MGSIEIFDEGDEKKDQVQLMISGVLTTARAPNRQARIERGMRVMSRDGEEAGRVAAVAVTGREEVDFFLLSRLPAEMIYRVVSAAAVADVDGSVVWLQLNKRAADELPQWSAE